MKQYFKINLFFKIYMRLILIAAMDPNRVIWKNNDLPRWRAYPEDLQRFKEVTSGHTIVMGRKTYDSIGRPLPNRRNIVLTRSGAIDGVETFDSINAFLETMKTEGIEDDIFIIWGSTIYEQFLDTADILDITEIKQEYEGDTFFPEFKDKYQESNREEHEKFDFVRYIRK